MKALKYLMLHCTASRASLNVTPETIRSWHTGPSNLPDGKVKYMGKVYDSRSLLPDVTIDGRKIKDIVGRGWSQVGYSKLISLATTFDLVHYDEDQWVEANEITNGAEGMNSFTRHFVYAGGIDDAGNPLDTRNPFQLNEMKRLVFEEVSHHPDILVCGHNHFANKACPSFNVEQWLVSIGVPEKNIYRKGK
jgi:hypothetical protein